jgi:DMSO/TMAO reductase YedYZ molybdopterin-dependent catalytic subunit
VHHLRRRDRPNELESVQIVASAVEETLPASREDGDQIDPHFVAQGFPPVPMWDETVRGRWSLEMSGLVRQPLKLSLDDLLKLKQTRQRVNHSCVEGCIARRSITSAGISTTH